MRALPAHVALEAYSVLTRLPAGLAVPPALAADVLATRFEEPLLTLGGSARQTLLATLSAAGVHGGSGYDGLVGLEAKAHGHELLTLDPRARETYRRLDVPFRAL